MPINFSKHLLSNFTIIFFINLLFFLITIDNPLYSDDYGTIVGTKLYNLGYAKALNQLGLGLWLFTTINITLGIFNLRLLCFVKSLIAFSTSGI